MNAASLYRVQQLVEGLYSASGPGIAKEIQEQLQAIQRQQQGWELASQLLSLPSDQCRFFGALTFQVKIARDWNTLPESRIDWLRHELLSWIVRSCTGPRFITTKLCLALITYALHTVPMRWQNFIPGTVNAIHAGAEALYIPKHNITMTMLEFLTLVPEEVANTEIISTRKPQITQELKNSTSLVLTTLSSILTDDTLEPSSQQRSLETLQSWIQYGIELEAVYPLLQHCMLFLGNENLFSSATNVLLEAMQQSAYAKYETFRNDLLSCFTSDGMRAKFAECIADENDEEAALIAKLLTEFAETFTDFVAAQLADVNIKLLLDMMMQLTDFPGSFPGDQEVSDIPLNFWYMLQETLFDDGIVPIREEQQATSVTAGENDVTVDGQNDDPVKRAWISQCGETGLTVYRRLVIVLKRKAMFPDDPTWNSWQKDTKDRFKKYRRDLADTLVNPYYLLRDEMLHIIIEDVISLLNRWQTAPAVSQELEAALFCLKSVCEEIQSNESENIRKFFGPEILERFPRDADIRLQNTAILVIGSLAEWLKAHPDYLPTVMNYIVPCLSMPRLSPAAGSAFSDICDACRESLASELNNLMRVYNSMANSLIEPNIMQKVVESVAGVIQVLPPEAAILPLMALMGDILQGVRKALSTVHQDPEAGREHILVQIKYLSACCRGIQPPNDDYQSLSARNNMYDLFASGQLAAMYANVDGVRQIAAAILETTQQIVAPWQCDEEVMKALSIFIESGIRSTSPLLTLRFDDLTALVITCYSAAPFACWLHTSGLIMTVYGGAQGNHIRLRDMLGALTEKSLSFISRTEDMEQYPDVVDSYFDLLSGTIRRCPRIFFELPPPMVNAILLFTIAGMSLQERLALKAALNFMADFIGQDHEEGTPLAETVNSIMMNMGMQIMEQLLAGIGGRVPRSFSGPLVDVLYKMIGRYTEGSRHWLHGLLALEGFPSPLVQQADKEAFMKGILGQRSFKRFKQCTHEFSTKCRGLGNTAYGSIA